MPTYTFYCLQCGAEQTIYCKIENRDKAQACGCGGSLKRMLDAPLIHADLPGYQSPVTGKWIDGRKAREDDLKRTGSRPYEGLEQELKEANRHNAYREAKEDAVLEQAIGETIGALAPEKKRILGAQ